MNNLLVNYYTLHASPRERISVYWDDVGMNFVDTHSTEADNFATETVITSGADLAIGVDWEINISNRNRQVGIQYKFCDGPNLITFEAINVFPYARKITSVNHFSCANVVCDLAISDLVTVVNASDTLVADGSLTVTATSSNGTIKFSLIPDFNYTTEGQGTGYFPDLFPGKYTVTAKDAIGCIARIDVVVGIPTNYGIHYRLQYFDLYNKKTRVDIYQRGYSGDIVYVKGTADPFVLKGYVSDNQNKFDQLMPLQAQVNLEAEDNFYYRDLFSQDDRKYRVEYQKDFGTSLIAALSALSDFVDDASGFVVWDSEPQVLLSSGSKSDKLIGAISNTVNDVDYLITYNIDVTFSAPIADLPALSTFTNTDHTGGNPTGANWTTGSTPYLDGNTSASSLSKALTGAYSFTSGTDYVFYYDFVLTSALGTPIRVSISLGGSDFISIGSPDGILPGHYTGSITIHTTASRGTVLIFARDIYNDSGAVHDYTITLNSLTLSPNVLNADFVLSTLDTLKDTVDSHTLNFTSSGNKTGTVTVHSALKPSFLSLQAINGVGNAVTVKINSITIDSTPKVVGYELLWKGFVLPQNYTEAYIAPPYSVSITATDGIADLKNYDFVDSAGNKFKDDMTILRAVNEILRITNLNLNVQCAVNKFELRMDSDDTDDPFVQATFNPTIFYNDDGTFTDCEAVLQQILKSFGARIVQRKGKWLIYCVEESVHDVAYREFLPDGTFLANGIVDDLTYIDIPVHSNRVAFRDLTQVLDTVPAYGKFSFKNTLIQNPSLVKSYSFELDDVIQDGAVTSFKNWNVNIINSPGATVGIKDTKSFQGDWNFFVNLVQVGFPPAVGLYTVELIAKEQPFEYGGVDAFEYSFDYSIIDSSPNPAFNAHAFWVRLKWFLKVGDYYYNQSVGWTNNVVYKYNDIYVSSFNSNQNLKIVADFRDIPDTVTETFQVGFVLSGNRTIDLITDNDLAVFKSLSTTSLLPGYQIHIDIRHSDGHGGFFSSEAFYKLDQGTDANDGYITVRPSDFNATTNAKVWRLQDPAVLNPPSPGSNPGNFTNFIYLDNVVFNILPGGFKSPTDVTIVKTNNDNIKVNYEDDFMLNDIDIDNITNSERTYENFFKLLNGDPTQIWARTYRSGEGKVLDLLVEEFFAQYRTPSNRLTGNFVSDKYIHPSSAMIEAGDSNRLYMLVGFETHDLTASTNFDIIELKDLVNDPDSDAVAADFNLDFNLDFNS